MTGYCSTCRTNAGRNHLSTDTHRSKVVRSEHIPNLVDDGAARTLRLARTEPPVSDAENDAALRRLNGEPPAWVDESGATPDWMDPDYREPDAPEPTQPAPRVRPDPCLRCGRADFRTAKGRSWHVENVPTCRAFIRPDRHQYAAELAGVIPPIHERS